MHYAMEKKAKVEMMNFEDKIILHGLRFYGYHGVLPQERDLGQWFEIDLELTTDLSAAGAHDDLTLTVDYSAVYAALKAIAEGPPFALIETLADRMLRACFHFPGVEQVAILVKKPQAPIPGPMAYCAVSLCRNRGDLE